MTRGITAVFIFLSALYLAFSFSIYLYPLNDTREINFNKSKAADGRLVWQKYNCQTCHQLFGLGGYLGPDLTNIYSAPGKGEKYLRAMLPAGVKQMPAFQIPSDEIDALVEFLKSTDQSGTADPRSFKTNAFGMIHNHD
jgi:nitric oxide reductase subunit C